MPDANATSHATSDATSRLEDGRHRVRILGKEVLNHNVTAWTAARPEGYAFAAGEACRLAVDADNWRDEDRPFTMSSLPDGESLEWVIKHHPDHHGMTERLAACDVGDHLLMGEPGGSFHDRGPPGFSKELRPALLELGVPEAKIIDKTLKGK